MSYVTCDPMQSIFDEYSTSEQPTIFRQLTKVCTRLEFSRPPTFCKNSNERAHSLRLLDSFNCTPCAIAFSATTQKPAALNTF